MAPRRGREEGKTSESNHLHNIPLSQCSTRTLRRNPLQEAQIALQPKLTLLLLSLGRRSTKPAGKARQPTRLVLLDLARSLGVGCWWVPELVVCWRVGEGDERARGGGVDELVGAGESGGGLWVGVRGVSCGYMAREGGTVRVQRQFLLEKHRAKQPFSAKAARRLGKPVSWSPGDGVYAAVQREPSSREPQTSRSGPQHGRRKLRCGTARRPPPSSAGYIIGHSTICDQLQ